MSSQTRPNGGSGAQTLLHFVVGRLAYDPGSQPALRLGRHRFNGVARGTSWRRGDGPWYSRVTAFTGRISIQWYSEAAAAAGPAGPRPVSTASRPSSIEGHRQRHSSLPRSSRASLRATARGHHAIAVADQISPARSGTDGVRTFNAGRRPGLRATLRHHHRSALASNTPQDPRATELALYRNAQAENQEKAVGTWGKRCAWIRTPRRRRADIAIRSGPIAWVWSIGASCVPKSPPTCGSPRRRFPERGQAALVKTRKAAAFPRVSSRTT